MESSVEELSLVKPRKRSQKSLRQQKRRQIKSKEKRMQIRKRRGKRKRAQAFLLNALSRLQISKPSSLNEDELTKFAKMQISSPSVQSRLDMAGYLGASTFAQFVQMEVDDTDKGNNNTGKVARNKQGGLRTNIRVFREAGMMVRGTYIAPGKSPPEGERKLYLAIESIEIKHYYN